MVFFDLETTGFDRPIRPVQVLLDFEIEGSNYDADWGSRQLGGKLFQRVCLAPKTCSPKGATCNIDLRFNKNTHTRPP